MKTIDGKIYIEWAEAVEAGISENTLKWANYRKSPSWDFMDDPTDRRRVLIGWDKLKDEYKEKIRTRWGDPMEWLKNGPIRAMVRRDAEAERFYTSYIYGSTSSPTGLSTSSPTGLLTSSPTGLSTSSPTGLSTSSPTGVSEDLYTGTPKKLRPDQVKRYTQAAEWLNMLHRVTEQPDAKRELKRTLNLTMEEFFDKVCAIIKAENIALPASYRRLAISEDSALKRYRREGYKALLSAKLGNKDASKICDEASEALIKELIANPMQFDDVTICWRYNEWAQATGRATVTSATVGIWRRKFMHELCMDREGSASAQAKYLPQVKGMRPSHPLYLVEIDDNHIDLQFMNTDLTVKEGKYLGRYKGVFVIDSFNDYVLGYAIGPGGSDVTIELVLAAQADAMYYLRSLTGSWYIPHELKADNFGIKTLQQRYENITKFIKTPVGSHGGGYREILFGSYHWNRALKWGANNYTGHNITAKTRGVNMEYLIAQKKNWPLMGEEAELQIANFVYRLRHLPQHTRQGNTPSKHEQWMKAWNEMPNDQKLMITDEQFLLKYGVIHNADRPIRITNRGVEPQINNVQYSYDIDTERIGPYVGRQVNVIYDPYDMSRVLVTDGENLRLMAREARLVPKAIADHDGVSQARLWKRLHKKKDAVKEIGGARQNRIGVLQAHDIMPEALLTADMPVKEIRHWAEQRMLEREINEDFNVRDQY